MSPTSDEMDTNTHQLKINRQVDSYYLVINKIWIKYNHKCPPKMYRIAWSLTNRMVMLKMGAIEYWNNITQNITNHRNVFMKKVLSLPYIVE